MYTMKLEFDMKKVEEAGLPYDKMVEALDKICADSYFVKIGDCEYQLIDGESNVGAMIVVIARFKKQSWLIPNLKSWVVIDNGFKEDVLSVYKERIQGYKGHGYVQNHII